jgi:MFS family permease
MPKMLSDYWRNVRTIRRDAWIIMAGAAAFGFMWSGVSDAILNLFLVRMGYGPRFVGLSMATAAFGYALAALPAAAASRWLGPKRALIVGVLGWVVGMVALSLADLLPVAWQQPWILATRLFAVAALALNGVSRLPFLTGVTTPEQRPHAFALLWSLDPLGAVLGSLIGGVLPGLFASAMGVSVQQPRPYGYALAIGLVVHLPVLWALSTLREERPRERQRKGTVDTSAAPYVLLGVVALVCLLRVGGEFTARTFFNVYMDGALLVSTARIGAIVGLANLLSIPAPLATPPLVQKLGKVWTVVAGALGVAASIVLLGLGGQWVLAACAFVCMRSLAAMVRSVWTLAIQESVGPEWRSMASGVSGLASGLGVALTSIAAGYLVAERGYGITFVAGAVLVALGALVFWGYFHVPRRQVADRPLAGTAK